VGAPTTRIHPDGRGHQPQVARHASVKERFARRWLSIGRVFASLPPIGDHAVRSCFHPGGQVTLITRADRTRFNSPSSLYNKTADGTRSNDWFQQTRVYNGFPNVPGVIRILSAVSLLRADQRTVLFSFALMRGQRLAQTTSASERCQPDAPGRGVGALSFAPVLQSEGTVITLPTTHGVPGGTNGLPPCVWGLSEKLLVSLRELGVGPAQIAAWIMSAAQ